MDETSKCRDKRAANGDFEKYLRGRGIDIGCGSDLLIAPAATVDPWDQPQGPADLLLGVADATYDFVYSSHCLEHLDSVETALENWSRVLKSGGYLYLVVPDYLLYEKMAYPSIFNSDHKHTFSLSVSRQQVSRTNHWHIIQDCGPLLLRFGVAPVKAFLEDDYYDYNAGPGPDQTMWPQTLAQICFIGRKGGGSS